MQLQIYKYSPQILFAANTVSDFAIVVNATRLRSISLLSLVLSFRSISPAPSAR